MSQSGSGTPDPVLEGVELLFHQKGGSASFGAKMALSLNGVDPDCMNPITGSTSRAKCSNILQDIKLPHSLIKSKLE
jgi:hypothetical protein